MLSFRLSAHITSATISASLAVKNTRQVVANLRRKIGTTFENDDTASKTKTRCNSTLQNRRLSDVLTLSHDSVMPERGDPSGSGP